MSADFYDHDGPGGKPTDRHGDRTVMAGMDAMMPDQHVEVVDSLAEGDNVLVRNIGTGTHADPQAHGVPRLCALAHRHGQARRTWGHGDPVAGARRPKRAVVKQLFSAASSRWWARQ